MPGWRNMWCDRSQRRWKEVDRKKIDSALVGRSKNELPSILFYLRCPGFSNRKLGSVCVCIQWWPKFGTLFSAALYRCRWRPELWEKKWRTRELRGSGREWIRYQLEHHVCVCHHLLSVTSVFLWIPVYLSAIEFWCNNRLLRHGGTLNNVLHGMLPEAMLRSSKGK